MKIGLFVPAYREIVRVQHEFGLFRDLHFIMDWDHRATSERNRLLETGIDSMLQESDVSAERLRALVERVNKTAATREVELDLNWQGSTNIVRSRNLAMKRAIERKCDLLYMVDSDCFTLQGSGLAQLMRTMADTEAAAVGGAFVCRGRDKMNCEPARPGEVYEGEVGTGMMLVDVSKVAAIPAPWFDVQLSEDGCSTRCGEDIYFCRKLRAHGLKVVVDYTIPTGHGTEEVLAAVPAELTRSSAETGEGQH